MVNVARPIGELDLHLFGEGTHRRLWELLGPQSLHVDAEGAVSGVRFAVWAPNASAVAVVGDWSDWAPTALRPIETDVPTGIWSATVPSARSGHRYKFEITAGDGAVHRKADPMARRTERPPSDASVVPCATVHDWGDDEWMAARGAVIAATAPMRVYEVHLGSWRQGVDTWEQLAIELAEHVGSLGFTHVELMPIAEHPYGGSWGYQVSGYFSPTARFGEPDGLRRFVDVLHRSGIGVIVDWVPAHFPRDAWSLGRFDGTALYEHPDPQRGEHPDWGTYVFDYGRNEVRNFLVANALYWLDEFHIDALRVDAVASMLYLDYSRGPGEWTPNADGGREHHEAVRFLRELTAVVGEEFPDALVIAEESTAWPGVTRRLDQGGLGFSHKWNLGWMHDTLDYLTVEPGQRRRHHQRMALPLQYAHDERFVLPLGHDEVVHGKGSLLSKMGGDEPQRFASLRMLFAWQWASPGAPLLFMGSELASRDEWTEQDTLPWYLLDEPSHRGVHDLVVHLNVVADSWPALWRRDLDPGGFQWLDADADADDDDHAMFAFVRWDLAGAAAVVCLANFSDADRKGYRVGVPWAGRWDVVLDTDDPAWNGRGVRRDPVVVGTDDPWQGCTSSAQVDVGATSMVWLAARSPG
jgi:1,4-alpha-glucan branching enzyme